jgi:hypothetical protein
VIPIHRTITVTDDKNKYCFLSLGDTNSDNILQTTDWVYKATYAVKKI